MLGIVRSGITKKKTVPKKCACQISGEPLLEPEGYIITTEQLISSRRFWDKRMTDSDTLSYTLQHFREHDQRATSVRKKVFEKYCKEQGFLLVSPNVIDNFDLDKVRSKALAEMWWKLPYQQFLEQYRYELQSLPKDDFEKYKAYAIIYAGKKFVQGLR